MKNTIDFIFSFTLLIMMIPIFIVVSFLIYIKLGSPIIFTQVRPGKYGKSFLMFKFRTMTNECDSAGKLLPDHIRLTSFGKFLRNTSIDELPELWNVLKGDMSLVGPRPLLMEYLPRYSIEQARRHEVRPGITGWAQVNGRNAISWEEKFRLDTWYVDNQSFFLDMKILVLTIKKVFSREDINHSDHATMPPFRGNLADEL